MNQPHLIRFFSVAIFLVMLGGCATNRQAQTPQDTVDASVPSDLVDAIRNRETSMVRELINAGADVNDAETVPLVEAVVFGLEFVRLLLDAGADVNIEIPLPSDVEKKA